VPALLPIVLAVAAPSTTLAQPAGPAATDGAAVDAQTPVPRAPRAEDDGAVPVEPYGAAPEPDGGAPGTSETPEPAPGRSASGVPAPSSAGGDAPLLFHVPPSTLPAGEPWEPSALVSRVFELVTLELVFRRIDDGVWRRVPFRRSSTEAMGAVVPGEDIAAPGVEYFVVSRDREGVERYHFGSEARPHRVSVVGLTDEQEAQVRAERYGNRRHRFAARGEYAGFADRSYAGWTVDPGRYPEPDSRLRPDDLYELRFDYTYRILSWVHAIHFGFGHLRGRSPWLDYSAERGAHGVGEAERTPGYDFGWTAVTFELHRYVALVVDVYLGGSAFGFDGGGGGVFRIGNTAETHLDLGFDYVSRLGYRAWFAFTWDTVPRVPMTLGAEFTDWPAPDDDAGDGVRLWYAAAVRIWDGLIAEAKLGYAARHGAGGGGVFAGGGIAYEF
jgi:hypothetical protein